MCIPKKLRGICCDEGVRVRLTGFSPRNCVGATAKSADKTDATMKRVSSMLFIRGSVRLVCQPLPRSPLRRNPDKVGIGDRAAPPASRRQGKFFEATGPLLPFPKVAKAETQPSHS